MVLMVGADGIAYCTIFPVNTRPLIKDVVIRKAAMEGVEVGQDSIKMAQIIE